MKISDSDKIQILLNRLDYHFNEIYRRIDTETRWFTWSATFLSACFVAIITLAETSMPLTLHFQLKLFASAIIAFPPLALTYKIWTERKSIARQGRVIVAIQNELKLFDEGFYLKNHSVYPDVWMNLEKNLARRRTPEIYSILIWLMIVLELTVLWRIV